MQTYVCEKGTGYISIVMNEEQINDVLTYLRNPYDNYVEDHPNVYELKIHLSQARETIRQIKAALEQKTDEENDTEEGIEVLTDIGDPDIDDDDDDDEELCYDGGFLPDDE